MGSTRENVYQYETVTGFFRQAEPDTNPEDFDNAKTNFGLIDRAYDTDGPGDESLTQWQRFEKYLRHLVKNAPEGTKYKLIYNGRHGEGFHNVAEKKYGTPDWNAHWSSLEGDGELFWSDAHLTPLGEQQAHDNNAFFKKQFAVSMPAPERYYVSPLYRCLQTANLTFSGLDLPEDRPFQPMIKELLREVIGIHTCDRRSSRTVIHDAVPTWDIEEGFTEEDVLWTPDHHETRPERWVRTQEFLDDIFTHDKSVILSFTDHSGMSGALLHVMNHREFSLPTGGLIPIFVKARKINS